MNKTDFDNKITSFNRRIISNKIENLEVQKQLNSLITKNYNFFLGRIYLASDDGPQNMLVYQPTFGVLNIKKAMVVNILLVRNQKMYMILNL